MNDEHCSYPPEPIGFAAGFASVFMFSSSFLAFLASLESESTVFVTLKKAKLEL